VQHNASGNVVNLLNKKGPREASVARITYTVLVETLNTINQSKTLVRHRPISDNWFVDHVPCVKRWNQIAMIGLKNRFIWSNKLLQIKIHQIRPKIFLYLDVSTCTGSLHQKNENVIRTEVESKTKRAFTRSQRALAPQQNTANQLSPTMLYKTRKPS